MMAVRKAAEDLGKWLFMELDLWAEVYHAEKLWKDLKQLGVR